MAAVSYYKVTATRWEHGWELDIDGVGVTQSYSLADAERMVRDYLRLDLGDDIAQKSDIDFHLVIDGLERDVERVRTDVSHLADQQRQVASDSRALAHALHDKGLPGTDVARVLNISPQRVSQLLRA